jgi:hypothetical protein
MKERILSNWTFSRGLYFVIGSVLMIESIMSHNWPGILFGGYFAAMGLFAFGCASGHCYGANCAVESKRKSSVQDSGISH